LILILSHICVDVREIVVVLEVRKFSSTVHLEEVSRSMLFPVLEDNVVGSFGEVSVEDWFFLSILLVRVRIGDKFMCLKIVEININWVTTLEQRKQSEHL